MTDYPYIFKHHSVGEIHFRGLSEAERRDIDSVLEFIPDSVERARLAGSLFVSRATDLTPPDEKAFADHPEARYALARDINRKSWPNT